MRNLKCKIKAVACREYYFLFFLANGANGFSKTDPFGSLNR